MAKFHLVYNPYLVEASLYVLLENRWLPVSEESGLLYIAKSRLQRWLEVTEDTKNYFNKLLEASGERNIEIFFSGTSEDLSDLKQAAKNFQNLHPQFQITIIGDEKTVSNDSSKKFQQLKEILSEAQNSRFNYILPKKFWDYVEKFVLKPVDQPITSVELLDWQKNFMQSSDWQMLVLKFSFQEARTEKIRQKLKDFAECLAQVDRNLERERFLFLCECETTTAADDKKSEIAIAKLLLEYGLQDLRFSLVTTEEIKNGFSKENKRILATKKAINIYCERYAEQCRIRKVHDFLKKTVTQEGFITKNARNFRRVEQIVRLRFNDNVDDKVIYAADKWLNNFFCRLNHLLDIGTTLPANGG